MDLPTKPVHLLVLINDFGVVVKFVLTSGDKGVYPYFAYVNTFACVTCLGGLTGNQRKPKANGHELRLAARQQGWN